MRFAAKLRVVSLDFSLTVETAGTRKIIFPAGVRIQRKFLYSKKLCDLSAGGGEKCGLVGFGLCQECPDLVCGVLLKADE